MVVNSKKLPFFILNIIVIDVSWAHKHNENVHLQVQRSMKNPINHTQKYEKIFIMVGNRVQEQLARNQRKEDTMPQL